MSNEPRLYDFAEFVPQSPLRGSFSPASELDGFSFWDPSFASTPATSPPASEHRSTTKPVSDAVASINLTSPVTLSFTKGSKLFKLKYNKIDVCKDNAGAIRCIELNDTSSLSGPFIHTFTSSKRPIPHLEQPATSSEKSLRVSFLEEQTVQVAQTVFTTQPIYVFERTSDCDKFQEAVLGISVLFIAGVAEIVSKGRGEEAISQNIRVCKSAYGNLSIIFFTNSQRKEKKQYCSVPIPSIDAVEPPKKAGKPVQIKLNSTSDISSQFKSLNILFIDNSDAKRFCTLMRTVDVKVAGR